MRDVHARTIYPNDAVLFVEYKRGTKVGGTRPGLLFAIMPTKSFIRSDVFIIPIYNVCIPARMSLNRFHRVGYFSRSARKMPSTINACVDAKM